LCAARFAGAQYGYIMMHSREDAIRHDHGQSTDARPPLDRLGWAALISTIYLPAAATLLLFIIGGILCRHGNVAIWNRLLGPLAMITFGWTFLGASIWHFSHRSPDVRQAGAQGGRSKPTRWADTFLPVLFAAALMAIGICILFWRRS